MDIVKKLGKLLLLNLIWLLFSLPVITVGASTCAAFSVALKLAGDEEVNIWQQFIKGFKQSWFQGILMGILTIAFSVAGVFLWKNILADPSFLRIIGAILYTIFAILLNFFTFPLIARYSNTLANVIKNSISIFVQFFKPAVKCVLITAIEVLVIVFSRYAFFVAMLFMPAIIIYTISCSAKDFFEELENRVNNPETSEESEDEESSDSEVETEEEPSEDETSDSE